MTLTRLRLILATLAIFLPGLCCRAASAVWSPIGPDGGDARRFAYDPRDPSRIYVGTTDSWIYISADGGSSWSRLARLNNQDDLVVDSLLVDRSDPRTLYAGVWELDRPDGGVYVSHDQGRTWIPLAGIQGQSVLALAQAPNNPRVLVAGTLRGVYRSDDKGLHWREISPPGSTEIHEVESIAIDPYDPQTIYAGTWHLPWKTSDGGAHWTQISKGVIVDSDVFSMVIDSSRPSVMFLSACSGIYRTDDGGADFRKVQGIPTTARRTRMLKMDPTDRNVVYAGTTEGLYKTTDGGDNWTRTTGSDVIINDVYVDPRNPRHVLLATDRSGVLASEDAGVQFTASNTGFSQRQVAALLTDVRTPGTMYAGVINDKVYGGVFVTRDFGRSWRQQSQGLNGKDVFVLAQGRDGTLLAGTSDGTYRWDGQSWVAANTVEENPGEALTTGRRGGRARGKRGSASRRRDRKGPGVTEISGRVRALATTDDVWYAATPQGVFRSVDRGASWQKTVLGRQDAGSFSGAGSYVAIAVSGGTVFAARRQGLMESLDSGMAWHAAGFPAGLTALNSLAIAGDGSLWAGGREGLFYSTDHGQTWKAMRRLPMVAINSVTWDPVMRRVVVTSQEGTVVFAIDPRDQTWKWWNTGWTVRSVSSLSGRLVAASMYSGVVAQPEPEAAAMSAGGVQDAQK